jgi:hypothetical protein
VDRLVLSPNDTLARPETAAKKLRCNLETQRALAGRLRQPALDLLDGRRGTCLPIHHSSPRETESNSMSTSPPARPTDTTGAASFHPEGAGSWRRSSFCTSSGCVEITADGVVIKVRDSKLKNSPVLAFDPQEWRAFLDAVKAGEFACRALQGAGKH